MAASALPRPGTQLGPCEDTCEHRDCAATRALAAAPCFDCGQPIGYDTRFYQLDKDAYSHYVCAHAKIGQ